VARGGFALLHERFDRLAPQVVQDALGNHDGVESLRLDGAKLEPGKRYAVSLELAGHKTYQQDLSPDASGEVNLDTVLEQTEPAAPVRPAVKM
jgi:hypothetical protein